jgi:hypothetical protein
MSKRAWQIAAAAMLIALAILWWQNRSLRRSRGDRGEPEAATAQGRLPTAAGAQSMESSLPRTGALPELDGDDTVVDDGERPSMGNWLLDFFRPKPGETVLEYRDRVLPVVQAAAAPHRRRVRENFDAFADEADLDADQRRRIEAAVEQAGTAIQDRIMQGVLSGELMPPDVKPSTGVAFARDVLDLADGANRRTLEILSERQREILGGSRFDVVDYLVFSTRWEDMLGVAQ